MIKIIRAYYNWLETAPLKTHIAITVSAMILFVALQFVLPGVLLACFIVAVCLLYLIPGRVAAIGSRSKRHKNK